MKCECCRCKNCKEEADGTMFETMVGLEDIRTYVFICKDCIKMGEKEKRIGGGARKNE